MRNVAVKAVGTDASAERARVAATAEALGAKLHALEAAGAGGGILPGAPSAERALLTANIEKHQAARRRLEQLRIERTEAGAGSPRRAGLEQRVEEARAQEELFGDVVGRQKTIKRLWKEPTALFLATRAEALSLAVQLDGLQHES